MDTSRSSSIVAWRPAVKASWASRASSGAFKSFCQGDRSGVVGGYVMAEFPDSGQTRVMRETGEGREGGR